VGLRAEGNDEADRWADVSGRDRDITASPALVDSGGLLSDGEAVAGFFSRDQAGCFAAIGSVKKSARNGEASGFDEGFRVIDFVVSSPVTVGNGPAGLNSLGGGCEATLVGFNVVD
jgi:hypothetical protein